MEGSEPVYTALIYRELLLWRKWYVKQVLFLTYVLLDPCLFQKTLDEAPKILIEKYLAQASFLPPPLFNKIIEGVISSFFSTDLKILILKAKWFLLEV